ncbi:hypothetical protein WS67_21445 [Burkholderia singularis]|uniref:Bacteriophage protein n=1 Tax=Burkholderia singularis TaxID=1503053 RepID=A0A124P7Z8_9BURK|nr:hypothetical protein [Burkholderia singularis]KVE23797.1 hypothetical protein WS67_21445 [Burkholderia singularis]
MRYRRLDVDNDYAFGAGVADFLMNTPETVAQAVLTRLRLIQGEWFLDVTAGMPWATDVLGKYTDGTADTAIRQCILGTQGVTELTNYSSSIDPQTRALKVTATINTFYGTTTVQVTL